MAKNVLIRKAIKEDYDPLMVLYNQFVGEDRYSEHSFDSFFSVLTNSSSRILVAEKDSILIGFATYSVRRVVRYPRPIAELEELFVSENLRKSGIGKALLEVILKDVKKRDCYRLYIESGYKLTDAHAFYKKLGFIEYGFHFYKSL